MISLNGIELDQYLQVPDWYTASGTLGSDRGPTLGGRLVSQRLGGTFKKITLTARLDGSRLLGHFKRHHVESLRAIADQGDPVEFIYHNNPAKFVNIPLDGIDLVMVGDRTDPPVNHPYVGTVTLLMRN